MLPPRWAEEVQHSLGDAIDLIIDTGPTPGVRPSSVIDVRGAIVAQLAAHGLHLDADSR